MVVLHYRGEGEDFHGKIPNPNPNGQPTKVTVTIGNRVKSVHDDAFQGIIAIESFDFSSIESSKLTRIGECAFRKRASKPFPPLHDSLTTIEDSAFDECCCLEIVNLENSKLKKIGNFAFSANTKLS